MTEDDAAPAEYVSHQRDDDSGNRRSILWLLTGLLGVAVLTLWAVGAASTAYRAYEDLDAARRDAVQAERQLRDAELAASRRSLDRAIGRAGDASDALSRPYMVPLRGVPLLGPNLRVAQALSDAARDGGTAAHDLLRAASTIISDDREQEVGEISVEYVEELAGPTRRLAELLVATTADIESQPTGNLLGRVSRARDQYLDLAGGVTDQIILAADLLEVLPAFLGADEPRTYLVTAGALSEIRASGGLLGSWSVLVVDEGRFEFSDFFDPDLHPVPDEPVPAPSPDYERRYARYDALRQWRNVNLTPDFPAAAEVLMSIWEAGGGDSLDGVIMADAVVFQRLASRAGGIEVSGIGNLQPDEILRFVALEAYDAFEDEDERKRVLGAVATAAFAELFEIIEDRDVPRTVEMLADLGRDGHVLVHARDPVIRQTLLRSGVGGELPETDGESAGVFTNNIAGNKVDWFLQRDIRHRVTLHPDGETTGLVDVRFHNEAPSDGYSRSVLGPWTERAEAGDSVFQVIFSCSLSCEVTESPTGASSGGLERGRPMVDGTLVVRAGETRQLRYRTSSRESWVIEDGLLSVRVQHLVQPTLHGTHLTIEIPVPDGAEPVPMPSGEADVVDGKLTIDLGRVSGNIELLAQFELPPTGQ